MASYGLFLNAGQQLGERDADIFATLLEEARLAEELGYRDLWLTEHHFIPFGINSNALTLAAFLLGRTQSMRIGTAVTLSPLYDPVQLAGQVHILDQCSGGRLDVGLGRGGYLRDFEVFGIDPARWDDEPELTARILLDAAQHESISSRTRWTSFEEVPVRPRPLTAPHPPLFLATSSPGGVAFAAENGLPLLHYFATPAAARRKTEYLYAEQAAKAGRPVPDHVHTIALMVTEDEETARAALHESFLESFRHGDWPPVPQAKDRHKGPDGKPVSREQMAAYAAEGAIIGPPECVARQLAAFQEETGAQRLVFYMEPLRERRKILRSVERFAREVKPLLGQNAENAAAAAGS